MEDYDSYESSGLELFHLSDVLDKIGEGILRSCENIKIWLKPIHVEGENMIPFKIC